MTVIQSYKKVLNYLPASFGAGNNNIVMVQGKDSLAAGQTGVTDADVPTGSIIKYIEIQFALANNGTSGAFINIAIQYTVSTQTPVAANAIGGDEQRNQVLHQRCYQVAPDQNSTAVFRFKVPPKFRRVREGMDWVMNWSTSESMAMAAQVIYKFYR